MEFYYQNHRDVELAKKYNALDSFIKAKLEKEIPRQEVTQKHDISWLSSTFIEVIEDAKEFAKKWKKSINDVSIEHTCYQRDYSDSWSSEIHLEVDGLETDDQYMARLMERYEATRVRDEYERREFERLKAKFNS